MNFILKIGQNFFSLYFPAENALECKIERISEYLITFHQILDQDNGKSDAKKIFKRYFKEKFKVGIMQ